MSGDSRSPLLSKSTVRKAGSRFREIEARRLDGEAVDMGYRNAQLRIIEQYRAQFQTPLNSMNSSLRSYLSSLGLPGEVTQRLKRMPTIIDKIVRRENRLDLSRMRDIGGCRVVTVGTSIADLYTIADRVEKKNVDCKRIDYVAEPRVTGYRALHLEVVRAGLPVEVQLRTPNMHRWAETMEAFSDVLGENYKQDGDTAVHRFMRLQMEMDRSLEQGIQPGVSRAKKIALLAEEITALLKQTIGLDAEEE